MDGKKGITTQFDELLARIKSAGEEVSITSLSTMCDMSEKDVLKWVSVLEKSDQVKVENRFKGVFVSWSGPEVKPKDEVEIGEKPIYVGGPSFESELEIAREREQDAKSHFKEPEKKKIKLEPQDMQEADNQKLKQEQQIVEQAEQEIQKEEPTGPEKPEPIVIELPKEPEGEKEKDYPIKIQKAAVPAIKLVYDRKKARKIKKIKKPEPVKPTGVSLQFSERMARQVKKITNQTQEIEKLRMEKEKLLKEHYLPMQRKLECEIETISDRVMKMEKNILAVHQRASDLPSKVSSVEKVQHSSINAHNEMRKAYDEASALIEETGRLLAEEREKMEVMVDQSRHEIAEHKAKAQELRNTLEGISKMEEEAAKRVVAARAAVAEQAERLESAEKYSSELSSLKEDISGSIETAKHQMSSAKGLLSGMAKNIEQMRQVDIWANSVREDYEKKMAEIDDYIRGGNQEFDTLRESVEANFVRRYLRELRQLTDSYEFEFDQARKAEEGIDTRIETERKKLESLLEEGRKISHLYEMQAKPPEGEEKFEQRGEAFQGIEQLANQRNQLEQMIAQVVGKKTQYEQLKHQKPKAKSKKKAPKKARKRQPKRKIAKKTKRKKPKRRKARKRKRR